MTAPKKPETPEEQWEAVVRFALRKHDAEEAEQDERPHNDPERMADKTDEELNASLRAHGYDVEKIDREGDAFMEEMLGALHDEEVQRASVEGGAAEPSRPALGGTEPAHAQPAEVISFEERAARRRIARRSTLLLAAAIAASLAVGSAITVAVVDRPKRHFGPDHGPSDDRQYEADGLRLAASDACEGAAWAECLAKLDEAKKLDPAGETTATVVAQRAQAAAGLAEQRRQEDERVRAKPDAGDGKGQKGKGPADPKGSGR
jgi:hypothetical protein